MHIGIRQPILRRKVFLDFQLDKLQSLFRASLEKNIQKERNRMKNYAIC